MPRLACIVEGQGDVLSVPRILYRLAEAEGVLDLLVVGPIRVARQKLVRPGELERAVELAARRLGGPGGVLVVIDADDNAPCRLGPELAARARRARADRTTCVVLANREKEAWLISAIESLRGQRDVPADAEAPPQPEAIRGAKEWMAKLMGRPYSEVSDQPALTSRFDLARAAERSPSFAKLRRDLRRLLA